MTGSTSKKLASLERNEYLTRQRPKTAKSENPLADILARIKCFFQSDLFR